LGSEILGASLFLALRFIYKHPHIKEELPKHTIVRESISTTAAEAREEESTNKVDHSFQCFHSICGLCRNYWLHFVIWRILLATQVLPYALTISGMKPSRL
jgi:hypothetical protein